MTAPPWAESLVHDPDFSALKSYVIGATGLAYYSSHNVDFARPVAERMAYLRLTDGGAYLSLLQDAARGEAELDVLVTQLTIGETYFLRYPEQFTALRDVIFPYLIRKNQDRRTLRIWSAGCATGAEPYSISIVLRRDLAVSIAGWDVTILATDINRDFLARAGQNEFPAWSFRGVPEDVRAQCFTRRNDGWAIAPAYQQGVHFQYHNLIRHPFPSPADGLLDFDLIMCRNVLIYFEESTTRRLIGQFKQSLMEGGWLLVGHAECNVDLFKPFRRVGVPGATLYQNSDGEDVETAGSFDALEAVATGSRPHVEPSDSQLSFASTVGGPAATRVDVAARSADGLPQVRALMDRGQWDEADAVCQRLMAVDRLNPMIHFYLALVQEQRGSAEQAEQTLRRALYLDRTSVLAHYHLGLLQARRADGTAAIRSFQNALRLLEGMGPDQTFPHADGLTVSNLQELASMHLKVLRSK